MKPKVILVMGLPGSGKTTLSKILKKNLGAAYINADEVRKKFNDWDFSIKGRERQAKRMKELAQEHILKGSMVIADFICPTFKTRNEFNADFLIFMDTIDSGRYDDTNKLFEKPKKYDFLVKEKNAEIYAKKIIEKLNANK
tara:strand:- start:134 stop:556 length:423 start_codon:yes stop_codon:yes gene_type:complete